MRFGPPTLSILATFFLALGFNEPALGGGCESPPIGPAVNIGKFTNYAPSAGGINGSPGKSASGRPAKDYYLEDYLEGRAKAVMGAVPQKGGTSKLFGAQYSAPTIQKAVGAPKCITVIAADRYAKASNGMSKMDIVTKQSHSETISKFSGKGGQLLPLGRIEGLPPPERKIQRNPAAVAPVSKRKKGK